MRKELLFMCIAVIVIAVVGAVGVFTSNSGHVAQVITQTKQAKQVEWGVVTAKTSTSYVDECVFNTSTRTYRLPCWKTAESIFKLYVADTKEKMAEGFRFKDSIDFEGKNASGMLFLLYKYYSDYVCFTMKEVNFSLKLLIGSLHVDIREKDFWKPNESRYYVASASIHIVNTYDLKPNDEVCISLRYLITPVAIELSPETPLYSNTIELDPKEIEKYVIKS
jgi:hypothetical protein